ncbi:hypothetical protein M5K25_011836 [Dendrobium thyrsiflorum]|uniref:Uncharacterized protein n=1 Tax=Dendrobium thyrsiflorum TaxID=117978 RepID=A0ABD0VAM5_DENTH
MPDFRSASNYCWSSTQQWSFRPPSLADNGFFNLHRPLTTVLPTSFIDYGLFDLRRQTMVFLTSVTRRQRSFRSPSLANYGFSDLLDYGPCDLLTTSFTNNGLPNLRHPPTMVFPTSVARRPQSFRPPSPTTVFPTFVAKQWSFKPLSLAKNSLFDLHRRPTTIFLTSFADYGPSDLRCQKTFLPTSFTNNGLPNLRCPPTKILPTSFAEYSPSDLRRQTTIFPTSVVRRLRFSQLDQVIGPLIGHQLMSDFRPATDGCQTSARLPNDVKLPPGHRLTPNLHLAAN